jgi:dTDP-4-dehydrorhamnose reductase
MPKSNLEIAKHATEIAVAKKNPLGAPVSGPQIADMRKNFVSKSCKSGILKTLAVSNAALTRYAQHTDTLSSLPPKTREKLAAANKSYRKSWSRKSAAMLLALAAERKRSAPKTKKQPVADATE